MSYRQLKVPEDLHTALKTAAAEEKTTMVKLLWKFMNKRAKKPQDKLKEMI